MVPYTTLERWANRPSEYPRYSSGGLRDLARIRVAGYTIVVLLGLVLLPAQWRPAIETAIFSVSLLLAGPLSTYLAIKSKYPTESFSLWFVFDGLFLAYLVTVSNYWEGLVVVAIAIQLCDGIILSGFRTGAVALGAFALGLVLFPIMLTVDAPLTWMGRLACWGLVIHGLVHLCGSFYLAFRFREDLVRRELQLKAKNQQIQLLNQEIREQVLVRYLPPELINDIFDGKITMDTKPHMRLITVLFSDLSGFTSMSEKHGAELVSEFLNDYLSIMNETIFAHLGTIDKCIGDAIMVIFGSPQDMSEEDQARFACLCAMAMQDRMSVVNDKWCARGIDSVLMRIGIHQGTAVVGNFGSDKRVDYTAIGPTVNLASRIESTCEAGKIFVSAQVRAQLSDDMLTAPAGDFQLKGIEGTISLYRLVTEGDA